MAVDAPRLADATLLVLDLQATGARPAIDHPFDLAWCRTRAAEPVTAIVACPLQLPADVHLPPVLRRRGCVPDATAAIAPSAALARLEADLDGIDAILVHYVAFEGPWLRAWFGPRLPPLVCVHALAKRLHPALPSHALPALAGRYGEGFGQRHRAVDHVLATHAVWQALASELDVLGIDTLPALLDWLATRTAQRPAGPRDYALARQVRLALPDVPGVYRYLDTRGRVLYVGKAVSLRRRVNSYFRKRSGDTATIRTLLTQAVAIDVTECPSAVHAAVLECAEIRRLDPPFNTALRPHLRAPVHLDRALTTASPVRDAGHRIGPWPGRWCLELWEAVCTAVLDGDPSALLPPVGIGQTDTPLPTDPPPDLRSAWSLPLPATRRDLLARALRRWRSQPRGVRAAHDDAGPTDDAGPETLEAALPSSAPTRAAAADPAERATQALATIAGIHARAHRLRRIWASRWIWEEGGRRHSIALADTHPALHTAVAAGRFDATAHDLAAVLAAELDRLRRNGHTVSRTRLDDEK